jgi:hypothetical protein
MGHFRGARDDEPNRGALSLGSVRRPQHGPCEQFRLVGQRRPFAHTPPHKHIAASAGHNPKLSLRATPSGLPTLWAPLAPRPQFTLTVPLPPLRHLESRHAVTSKRGPTGSRLFSCMGHFLQSKMSSTAHVWRTPGALSSTSGRALGVFGRHGSRSSTGIVGAGARPRSSRNQAPRSLASTGLGS